MKPWIIGEILLVSAAILGLALGFSGVAFWWTGFLLTWPLIITGGLLQVYQYILDKRQTNESQATTEEK